MKQYTVLDFALFNSWYKCLVICLLDRTTQSIGNPLALLCKALLPRRYCGAIQDCTSDIAGSSPHDSLCQQIRLRKGIIHVSATIPANSHPNLLTLFCVLLHFPLPLHCQMESVPEWATSFVGTCRKAQAFSAGGT